MSYYQLPADGAGKKVRTRERVEGADTVHEQAIYRPGLDTFYAFADAVVPAAGKSHIALLNPAASGKALQARKLFCVNLQTGAITGAVVRFNVCRNSGAGVGLAGGTSVVPRKADSLNAALPSGVLCASGATVGGTEEVLFPWITNTEERPATQPLNVADFQQATNILMEGETIEELSLNPGEALSMKQITSVTAGSLGWILVFTVE